MTVLGFTLAGVVGLLLGVLGGGGSILLVPMLVYALGVPPKEAVVISLPIVGLTSLAGATSHWLAGTVQVRSALAFGIVAMAGAFAGARLSVLLPAAAQLAILAVVMLAAGLSMLAARSPDAPAAGASPASAPGSAWSRPWPSAHSPAWSVSVADFSSCRPWCSLPRCRCTPRSARRWW